MPDDAPVTPAPAAGRVPSSVRGSSGRWLVVGLLALGVTAGITAIAFQLRQTGRCLAFYGPEVARSVSEAPRVELWRLGPTDEAGVLHPTARYDVSHAPGLVHLRRGLVEDANFSWPQDGAAPARPPAADWDVALVFSDPPRGGAEAMLVFDLPADGASGGELAVWGRPRRIGLGRIAAGLSRWFATVPGSP